MIDHIDEATNPRRQRPREARSGAVKLLGYSIKNKERHR